MVKVFINQINLLEQDETDFNLRLFHSTGVKIFEKVAVESIITDGKSITAVETNKGTINCEILVNCGGQVNVQNSNQFCPYSCLSTHCSQTRCVFFFIQLCRMMFQY